MYKKIAIISVLSFMSIGLSVNCYNEARQKAYDSINIEYKDSTIEYNTELSTNDIIKNIENATLKKNELIKTDTIGQQTLTISLMSNSYKDIQRDFTHDINIVDSVFPTIEGKEVSIMQGEEFTEDLLELKISDNYSDNIKIEKSNNIDTEEHGEYTFKVKATDEANNVTEKEFKVTIKEKPKPKVQVQKNNTSQVTNACKHYTDNVFSEEMDFNRDNRDDVHFKNTVVFLRGYVDNCVIQSYENEYNSLPNYLTSSPSLIEIYGRYIEVNNGIYILGRTQLGTSVSISGNKYHPGVLTHEVIHAYAGAHSLDNTDEWINIYNIEGNNLGKDTAQDNNKYEYFVTAFKLYMSNPSSLQSISPLTYQYFEKCPK